MDQILFLPGAAGDPEFWRPVAERLTIDVPKVLLGYPGFGATPADPRVNSFDALVDYVADRICTSTAIVAQSMGGVLAIRAALARRAVTSKLVLTATSGGFNMGYMGAEDWRPAFLATHPTVPRWFVADRSVLATEIPSLRTPTLLLWGDRDPFSPLSVGRRLAEIKPTATLHVFPGAGHDVARERVEEVTPVIDAFLREV